MLNFKKIMLCDLIALSVFLFIGSTCISKEAATKSRTVSFPSEWSVSGLFLIDRNDKNGMEKLGPAEGDIVVPSDKDLMLIISMLGKRGQALDLSPLDELDPNDIQMISFHATQLIPQELKRLERLSGLKGFGCALSRFNDECLEIVCNYKNLEDLTIPEMQVTDAGIQNITKLPKLKVLNLYNIKLSDVSLESICQLHDLQDLRFGHAKKITDIGLKSIRNLSKLEVLELWNTGITDNGLVYLNQMQGLRRLNLRGTAVTDQGLVHLHDFQNLEWLELKETEVTLDGVEILKKEIPSLKYVGHGKRQSLLNPNQPLQ